jgi:hypothetical protein
VFCMSSSCVFISIMCCVFALIVFVLCLVLSILLLSQDCLFLFAHSVFSNVYLLVFSSLNVLVINDV